MEQRGLYIRSEKNGSYWHSFFALRLASIGVFQGRAEARAKYVRELLSRQIDLINCLDCPEDGRAFELRAICRPHPTLITKGTVAVFVLAKVAAKTKGAAEEKAREVFEDLWSLLGHFTEEYVFEALTRPEDFDGAREPFRVNAVAEVLRREDVIGLETARRTEVKGFRAGDAGGAAVPPGPDGGKKDRFVYFTYPFIWSTNTLARVFTVLLQQKASSLLSVQLRPVHLTPGVKGFLLRQIRRCERFLTADPAIGDGVRSRVELIMKTLQSQLMRLEDSPFILKVRIASSASRITKALVDTCGVEMTEHAGSPDIIEDSNDAYVFSGGYDWGMVSSGRGLARERESLKSMALETPPRRTEAEQAAYVRYLFDSAQANCAFRLPVPLSRDFPGLTTKYFKEALPPGDVPEDGVILGKHRFHGQDQYIRILPEDRKRHLYTIGQTGTGKSTLFLSMILQDMHAGRGVAVVDPHGELIEEILPRIPVDRAEDVIYFNPIDTEYPLSINMLEYRSELEKDFLVDQLLDIFDKLYDLRATGGPIFEYYFRAAASLAMEDPQTGSTLLEIPRVFEEAEFRHRKLANCRDEGLKKLWTDIIEMAGGQARLENVVPYVTSKMVKFIHHSAIRLIVSSQRSSIDFLEVMNRQKIVLVNLAKGHLGDIASHFLGMVVMGKLLAAALSRSNAARRRLPDFYLYVDEFQNVVTPSFSSVLAEARKFGLCANLAHQFMGQISARNVEVLQSILGNVGTMIAFRVGIIDAETLEKEYVPVFDRNDLANVPNWRAYVSLLANGATLRPFSMETVPVDVPPDEGLAETIVGLSRLKYGRDRKSIEREIAERWSKAVSALEDEE